MDRQESGARRLGFMGPVLLFVLFFVICCGVLSGVFARSASLSAQARQLEAAVELSRNAAEVYTATGSPEKALALTGQGTLLRLNITETASKGMKTAEIRVTDEAGQTVYTLTVEMEDTP